jgi:hypothetical protein
MACPAWATSFFASSKKTFFGEGHAAFVAQEESNAEIFFELANLAAEGGCAMWSC